MSKKKARKSRGEIEADLCDLLSGEPPAALARKAPEFPYTFLVVRSGDNTAPVMLRKVEREAAIVDPAYVAGYLRKYVSRLGPALEAYNIPYDVCLRVVRAWARQEAHLKELPKAVAFKSDPDLALTRLGFDPVPVSGAAELAAKAPHFERILRRLSNGEAFCMRVGSFYDGKADRKQAVWVSGPGDTGKSVLPWLIDELLPGGTTSISVKNLESPHWMEKIVGKRVVHVKEAAASFIRTSEFKSFTGDSIHSINPKGSPMYDARIDALVFCYSNEEPQVPRDDALINRVIDCRLAPIPEAEPRYGDDEIRGRLRVELPFIAGYCLGRYATLRPGARIPCATETLQESVQSYEADYLAFLEREFIAAPDPETGTTAYLCRSKFREIMRHNGFVSHREQSILKRIMLSNFAVKERKYDFETNAEGVKKRLYVYEGVRERTQSERQFTNELRGESPNLSGTVLDLSRRKSRM